MTKIIAIIVLGTASLGLLAQPAGAAKPPKWTPTQEAQAREYYAAVGREPACAIKLAKKAYPNFKEWSRGGTRKFDRLRAQVKKKCAAVEPTPIPTVTAAPNTPAATTSPAPDRGQWNAASEELLLGLIRQQSALAPYDPQCVLRRIRPTTRRRRTTSTRPNDATPRSRACCLSTSSLNAHRRCHVTRRTMRRSEQTYAISPEPRRPDGGGPMRTLRRGIVVVALTAMFAAGVASVASAQAPPPQQPQPPSTLDPQTQQRINEGFHDAYKRSTSTDPLVLWVKVFAFAVLGVAIAVMVIVMAFALVSAQWRRARSEHPLRS